MSPVAAALVPAAPAPTAAAGTGNTATSGISAGWMAAMACVCFGQSLTSAARGSPGEEASRISKTTSKQRKQPLSTRAMQRRDAQSEGTLTVSPVAAALSPFLFRFFFSCANYSKVHGVGSERANIISGEELAVTLPKARQAIKGYPDPRSRGEGNTHPARVLPLLLLRGLVPLAAAASLRESY